MLSAGSLPPSLATMTDLKVSGSDGRDNVCYGIGMRRLGL